MTPLRKLRILGAVPTESASGIERLEAAIGTEVPSELREVIVEGGAIFRQTSMSYFDETKQGRVLLGWLMAAQECLDAWKSVQGSVEASLLPFGNDGGDNLLCIALDGPFRGQIFFHDHGIASLDPHDSRSPPTSAYFVASSFAKFVDSLRFDTVRG